MVQNYKLCQNCNNALDLNVSKCPYCGQVVWFDLSNWANWLSEGIKNIEKATNKKQTSGCVKVIIIFIVIQIVWAILSLIFQVLSWL